MQWYLLAYHLHIWLIGSIVNWRALVLIGSFFYLLLYYILTVQFHNPYNWIAFFFFSFFFKSYSMSITTFWFIVHSRVPLMAGECNSKSRFISHHGSSFNMDFFSLTCVTWLSFVRDTNRKLVRCTRSLLKMKSKELMS